MLHRFFGEGFRVFFLAAGIYALFAIGFWLLWLWVHWAGGMFTSLPFAMAPQLWHGHELVFGYGSAALGGFLLTAVPNWTGTRAARHLFIGLAAAVWLVGRGAVWHSATLAPALVMVADLAFLPLIALKIATQLVKRPKPQNLMFLGLIAILWTANLLSHLNAASGLLDQALADVRAGLYGLCAMIAVLGGRVTPAFTRNAMIRAGFEAGHPVSHRPLELAGVALAIMLPLAVMARVPDGVQAVILLVAGAVQLLRVLGWRPGFALGQPILWSLHLSFAAIGIGFILTGLALSGGGSEVAAFHVTAIGGVAGMTVAVMSRATLGHTGRALVAPRAVALAYVLLPVAAVLRWLASALGGDVYYPAIAAAGLAWLAAYGCYTAALWPAFWGPRPGEKE